MTKRKKIGLILTFAFWAAGVSHSQGEDDLGLTGAARDRFVGGAMRSCVEKQVSTPENASIGKPLLVQYCYCYANGMADRISNIRALELEFGDAQKFAEMGPVIEAASSACLPELVQGLPPAK
jgi:hypothetical protein